MCKVSYYLSDDRTVVVSAVIVLKLGSIMRSESDNEGLFVRSSPDLRFGVWNIFSLGASLRELLNNIESPIKHNNAHAQQDNLQERVLQVDFNEHFYDYRISMRSFNADTCDNYTLRGLDSPELRVQIAELWTGAASPLPSLRPTPALGPN
ncbi:hypothetical protein GEV33_008635 [Tenebrio molitor]|uniref:Uncharacterized protein n=1 Tax=Tenebrio molitor TaxID=7067 RepID=A0A8J6HGB1_TENMO|nr:hypothetical protein GEV33_008635 [Tenebrio molitor]